MQLYSRCHDQVCEFKSKPRLSFIKKVVIPFVSCFVFVLCAGAKSHITFFILMPPSPSLCSSCLFSSLTSVLTQAATSDHYLSLLSLLCISVQQRREASHQQCIPQRSGHSSSDNKIDQRSNKQLPPQDTHSLKVCLQWCCSLCVNPGHQCTPMNKMMM